MDEMICDAIRNRKVLRFSYDGGERTVEPYVYGTTRANVELLRAYQTAGFSRSGQPVGWKLFRVDGISGLSIGEETITRLNRDYKGADPTITTVHCQIQES